MVAKNKGCIDPQCFACTHSMAEVQERERTAMEKKGWYAHYVSPKNKGEQCNYHTHGLEYSLHHLNFQVVLPIDPHVVHNIIYSIIKRIREGTIFKDGDIAEGIIQNGYYIKFVAATENNRPVLRIIIPDADNNLDADTLDEIYKIQYNNLQDSIQ